MRLHSNEHMRIYRSWPSSLYGSKELAGPCTRHLDRMYWIMRDMNISWDMDIHTYGVDMDDDIENVAENGAFAYMTLYPATHILIGWRLRGLASEIQEDKDVLTFAGNVLPY